MKKKMYNLQDLKRIAADRGGRCLSNLYTRKKDKYKWECKCGYTWEATFDNISNGTWCPKCGGTLKSSISEMKKLAKLKGGVCLSETYKNKNTPLLWRCEKGHEFRLTPDSIKNSNTWCNHHECTSSPRYNIEIINKIAKEKGGKCLTKNYVNCIEKMKWQCEKGHVWETSAKYVLRGHWCHTCNIRPVRDLEYLKEAAKKKNGVLISNKYKGMNEKYEWECEKNHRWYAPAGAVVNGRWCHECRKGTIEAFQEIAAQKGGKCLSKVYVDSVSPLKFKCKEGHQFYSVPSKVKNNDTWCPYCLSSKWEEISRLIIEKLLGVIFVKTRRVLGDNLELDGYNSEKNIAFEFNGAQHYSFNKHFHHNHEGFLYQILTDLEKKNRCSKFGIKLIVIPHYVVGGDLMEFIKTEMRKLNIDFDENIQTINYNDIYFKKSKFGEFEHIAKLRNGKLLSTKFIDSYTKLHFECEMGHKFSLLPYKVKNLNKWCSECNKEKFRTLKFKELIDLVKKRNGKVISRSYFNSTTKMIFECKMGHNWNTSPAVVFKGHWCPVCSRIKV